MQVLQQDSAGQVSASAGASLECRLGGPGSTSTAWSPCNAAVSYTGLQDGSYLFSARVAGTTDAQTMAQSNFTVDTATPVTQVSRHLQDTNAPIEKDAEHHFWTRAVQLRLIVRHPLM